MSKEISVGQNISVGVMAAFIEAILLQPTLYWKNARCQQLPLSLDPRIIYRGTAASIFNEMQMMGLQFGITGYFKRLFVTNSSEPISTTQEMASAALGGSFTAFFSSPVELIMIQQQRHGGTFFKTPVSIATKYGLAANGIMRGLIPTMCRDSIYVVGMLGVTPIVQTYLQQHQAMSVNVAGFYASMIGGVFGALFSHPFDVVKTCMQGDVEQVLYKDIGHSLRAVWKEGGTKRMFNGLFWRTVNITGTVYVANECRIRLPELLFHDDNKSSASHL